MRSGSGTLPGAHVSRMNSNLIMPTRTAASGTRQRSLNCAFSVSPTPLSKSYELHRLISIMASSGSEASRRRPRPFAILSVNVFFAILNICLLLVDFWMRAWLRTYIDCFFRSSDAYDSDGAPADPAGSASTTPELGPPKPLATSSRPPRVLSQLKAAKGGEAKVASCGRRPENH